MAGTGPVTARIYPVGAPDDELVEHVAAALRTSGIRQPPAPHPPRDEAGPVVLVFDTFSSELAEAVRRAAAGGRQRVLAVAASHEGLPDGRAWELLRLGASDVLAWDGPQTAGRHGRTAASAGPRSTSWPTRRWCADHLVGQSQTWRADAAPGRRGRPASPSSSVLLTGESGTGKELVARLVHDLDQRPDKGRLVVVDCTTVVPTLSGSEFFGHERGAFTGAVSRPRRRVRAGRRRHPVPRRGGRAAAAASRPSCCGSCRRGPTSGSGSNVWQHDAVPPGLRHQPRPCRGAGRRHLPARLLLPHRGRGRPAAAAARAARGHPALFAHFLGRAAAHGEAPPSWTRSSARCCWRRDYPGNVRDLRQLALRISNRHVGPGPITAGDLPEEEWPARPAIPRPRSSADWNGGPPRPRPRRRPQGARATPPPTPRCGWPSRRRTATCGRPPSRLGVTDRALQLRRANRQQSRAVPARCPAGSSRATRTMRRPGSGRPRGDRGPAPLVECRAHGGP